MPPPKVRALTPRQRRFAQELPAASSGRAAAIAAGYSPIVADEVASQNLRLSKLQPAIAEAIQAATSEKVMSVIKRKERLSELAADVPTRRDPIGAIAELNKMDRVYDVLPARDSALEWLLELRKLMVAGVGLPDAPASQEPGLPSHMLPDGNRSSTRSMDDEKHPNTTPSDARESA